MSVVSYKIHQNIGIISLNNPPVNALSQQLRAGILQAVESAQKDESQAIVLICEGRTFIAGADITEFGKPPQDPSLPDLLTIVEASSKPIVAALHGTALGGGLETALACHYRCALASAKIGLPEVKLGLLPGAGGTQRLPRIAGVQAAIDIATTGQHIVAAKAVELGVIDRIIEEDLLAGALNFAQEIITTGAVLKRASEITIDKSTVDADVFKNAKAKLAKRARGQMSPQLIVDCIEAAVNLPFQSGMETERTLFMQCLMSSQSLALRHMFFAERQSAKIKGLAKDLPLRNIKSVGIIGGGTMGGGIAMNFVNVGIPVTLLEINDEALQRGKAIIAKNYAMTVKKGKLTEQQSAQCQTLITGSTDYADLSEVDMVIEAVFENIEIKKQVFAKLDKACKPGAILATNTSYQDVDLIAAATNRPEDVIGLHFFSPANVMKLLEIVQGAKTADDVVATSMAIAKTIKKVPVLSQVCYGFIGNRMLRPYMSEGQLCLIEGSTPEQIDNVMQEFGMAMGPLSVGDLAGLDIGYKAREGLSNEEKGDPKTYCISDTLVEMGRLGQKSGQGFYRYDSATRKRSNDPVVLEIIHQQAKAQGIVRREISEEEILNRLTFALINEGLKILEEGIAQRPSDIDVVYVYGYGFPSYRGGPMHYADQVGLQKVYDTICHYQTIYGDDNWQPANLLTDLVNKGKSLTQWAEEQL